MSVGLQLDPGEMTERVTIREKQETGDGAGGTIVQWADYATRWAKVKPMSGERRFAAAQTDHLRDTEVTVRRDPGITESMAIVWQGQSLDIRFIEDHGPRAAYMRLECQAGGVEDATP